MRFAAPGPRGGPAALRAVKAAAKATGADLTLTTVEWRGCPDGFVPPSS